MSIQKQTQKTSNYPSEQITINLRQTDDGWQAWEDMGTAVGQGSSAAEAVEDYARAVRMAREE